MWCGRRSTGGPSTSIRRWSWSPCPPARRSPGSSACSRPSPWRPWSWPSPVLRPPSWIRACRPNDPLVPPWLDRLAAWSWRLLVAIAVGVPRSSWSSRSCRSSSCHWSSRPSSPRRSPPLVTVVVAAAGPRGRAALLVTFGAFAARDPGARPDHRARQPHGRRLDDLRVGLDRRRCRQADGAAGGDARLAPRTRSRRPCEQLVASSRAVAAGVSDLLVIILLGSLLCFYFLRDGGRFWRTLVGALAAGSWRRGRESPAIARSGSSVATWSRPGVDLRVRRRDPVRAHGPPRAAARRPARDPVADRRLHPVRREPRHDGPRPAGDGRRRFADRRRGDARSSRSSSTSSRRTSSRPSCTAGPSACTPPSSSWPSRPATRSPGVTGMFLAVPVVAVVAASVAADPARLRDDHPDRSVAGGVSVRPRRRRRRS